MQKETFNPDYYDFLVGVQQIEKILENNHANVCHFSGGLFTISKPV